MGRYVCTVLVLMYFYTRLASLAGGKAIDRAVPAVAMTPTYRLSSNQTTAACLHQEDPEM